MARDKSQPGRVAQLRQVYRLTKQLDPKLNLILLATYVVVALLGAGLFYFMTGSLVSAIISGLLVGVLGVLIVFGRRTQAAQYAELEGKPGAAIAVMSILKRQWVIDQQPVAFTKQQDVISRVVGPPGIVLIGEGNPNRLKPLMTAEVRKHERVTSETPIVEIYIGHDAGQVAIPKLVKTVRKLPKAIKGAQMTDVLQRIRALDAQRGLMPIPKGPVPTSMKGQRGNLRGR